MQIYKEVDINAPINKVWKAFSQLEKWPKYCDCIKKAYWTSPEKWSLNSTFVQIIRIWSIKRISYPRIIKIKRGKYATWAGTGILVHGVHTLIFEKINKNIHEKQSFSGRRKSKAFSSETKVVNKEYFKGILAPIIFPFVKNKFGECFWQFLNGLKRECER